MNEARFEVEIRPEDARQFAELSGDWNPLHTDSAYAAATTYGKPILHGAFSAGLVSRMAGMYLPGSDCLLHGLNLRLVEPIVPPAALIVEGRITRMTAEAGRVEISVTDRQSGVTYVTGSYTFGYQIREPTAIAFAATPATNTSDNAGEARVLVTGAAGGLARAVLAALGGRGAAVSRSLTAEAIHATSAADLSALLGATPIAGIVHCGWPSPDNTPMIGGGDVEQRVRHYLTDPLADTVHLARLLATNGVAGAPLVLIGSTAARPGRHAFAAPFYSLGKAMIPSLVEVLAVELGRNDRRCFALILDVIAGAGMNERMQPRARQNHLSRIPQGVLPTPEEIAEQIVWLLSNRSGLLSGAVVTLSGGALP